MWAPLGSVLCFGLLVSMVLTLFVVPVMYYKFVKPAKVNKDAEEQYHTIETELHETQIY